MKNLKKQKGITLIALIITIIVMLILVTVFITLEINGNLFDKAGEAVRNTDVAKNQENGLSNQAVSIIDQYVANATGVGIHNWIRSGDNLTCMCSLCTGNGVNPAGRMVTIGETEIDYEMNGGIASTTINATASGVARGLRDGYITPDEKIQSDGLQTIARDVTTTWVVLGAEDQDNNETYETLLLTSSVPTTDYFYLFEWEAYNNGIEELNRICKELYGNDARSMKMEDVDYCLGYIRVGACCYSEQTDGSWRYYTPGNFTTTLAELGEDYDNIWDSIKDKALSPGGIKTYFTPEHVYGTTDENELGKLVLDAYYYARNTEIAEAGDETGTPTVDLTSSIQAQDFIFGEDNSWYYWLASRGVYADSEDASFGIGSVYNGFADSRGGYLFSDGMTANAYFCVRPVVSLKFEIPN